MGKPILNILKNALLGAAKGDKLQMKVTKESMKLYAITDRHWLNGAKLEDQVEEICKAGITFLQLREKNMDEEAKYQEALKVQAVAKKYNVPFVIDDDVELAKRIDCDGVHVGQSDMEYEQARKILGPDKIIGISAGNLEEALAAEKAGADYLGCGAVFPTSTKKDATSISMETLKEICDTVSIPVVAIGGITVDNARQLKGSGVDGLCVISAIFGAEDKTEACRQLLAAADDILE